jgi:hypothetical protein
VVSSRTSEIGLADPAAGIDPRAERPAEIGRIGRPFEPRHLDQGIEADIAPLCHHLDALGDEGAIEAAKLGDVGDRAQGDEIEQVDQARLLASGEEGASAKGPDECRSEQEGDSDRGEMAMGRGPRPSRRGGWG